MDDGTFANVTEPVSSEPRARHGLGLYGLLLAVLGLTLAITQPYLTGVIDPPPPRQKFSEVLSDAGEKLLDRAIAKVRGKAVVKAGPPPPAPAQKPPWPLYLSMAATLLGLAGAVSGMVGWIRREELRLTFSAITIGALAVAWVYIVAALVTALTIVFLMLLIRVFGDAL